MQVDLKCKICKKEFKNMKGLSSHITSYHKLSTKQYYDEFYKTNNDGNCLYCGGPTKFSKLSRGGYQKYCCAEHSYKSDLVKQNREKTNITRFGVKNPYQNEDVKRKIKQKQEKLYGGVGLGSTIIRNKISSTNSKKYGVENPFQSEEIKSKIKETNIKKYGVENPAQNKSIIKKVKNTKKEKYGNENFVNAEKAKRTKKERYQDENYSNVKQMSLTKKENIRQFEKENNCTQVIKLIKQLGPIVNKAINHYNIKTLHYNANRFISNNDIEYLKRCINELKQKSSSSSISEKEVVKYIKSIYSGEIIENTKKIISPYELDIYLPDKNLAIEFNGIYWHSNLAKNDDYHMIKSDLCESKSIDLIHIFEDDWLNKSDICKSIILTNMGIYTNIIDIGDCSVTNIDSSTAETFIYENYLYPEEYTEINRKFLGIIYNNKLVEVLQYKKIDDDYVIELRCIKLNTLIEGDMKYFINYFKHFRLIVDRSFEFYHTEHLYKYVKLIPKVLNKEKYILNSGYYILKSTSRKD